MFPVCPLNQANRHARHREIVLIITCEAWKRHTHTLASVYRHFGGKFYDKRYRLVRPDRIVRCMCCRIPTQRRRVCERTCRLDIGERHMRDGTERCVHLDLYRTFIGPHPCQWQCYKISRGNRHRHWCPCGDDAGNREN